MNLSSNDFIKYFYSNHAKESSFITPICVSPFTSDSQSLGIKIINDVKEFENKEIILESIPQSKLIMDSFYNIKDKNSIYYKITNYENISILSKVQLNRNVWNVPAFFPNNFVNIAISEFFIFIALCDNTINIVDKNNGSLLYPQIKVSNQVFKLVAEDNYLICITIDSVLKIWEITPKSCRIRSVMSKTIEYPLTNAINKIELTNELEDDSISPMLFFDNFIVRFSQSKNGWILTNRNAFKSDISQNPSLNSNKKIISAKMPLKTLYDVKKAFFDSLIYHETESFIKYLTILLQKYSKYKKNDSILLLIEENLDLIKNGVKSYCGIDPKNLLTKMINIVSGFDPSFESKIQQHPKYKEAFNKDDLNNINETQSTPKNSIQDEETFIWPIDKENAVAYDNHQENENAAFETGTDIIQCSDSHIIKPHLEDINTTLSLNSAIAQSPEPKNQSINSNHQIRKVPISNGEEKKQKEIKPPFSGNTLKKPNYQTKNKTKSQKVTSPSIKLNLLTEINKIEQMSTNKKSNKNGAYAVRLTSNFDISDSDLTSNDANSD